MLKCKKCGFSLEEGDIFCPECGFKQQDFEEKMKQGTDNNSDLSKNQNDVNQFDFKQITDVLIKMALKPIEGAKDFVEKANKQSAFILAVILSLVQGLLGIWAANQIINNINKVIVNFAKTIGSIISFIEGSTFSDVDDLVDLTEIVQRLRSFIQLPYGKIFFQNLLIMALLISVIFLGILVCSNIFSKKKSDLLSIFKISTVILIPFVYFQAISIVAFYANFYIGILLFLYGVVLSLGCLNILVNCYIIEDGNNSVFAVSLISLIGIIVCFALYSKFLRSNSIWLINHIKDISKLINF